MMGLASRVVVVWVWGSRVAGWDSLFGFDFDFWGGKPEGRGGVRREKENYEE